jgi:hypothetical protein
MKTDNKTSKRVLCMKGSSSLFILSLVGIEPRISRSPLGQRRLGRTHPRLTAVLFGLDG